MRFFPQLSNARTGLLPQITGVLAYSFVLESSKTPALAFKVKPDGE
jgi:hypothetical protein